MEGFFIGGRERKGGKTQRLRDRLRGTDTERQRKGGRGAGGRARPFKGGELRMCAEITQQARALPLYCACAQRCCTGPGLQGAGQVCPNASTFAKIWNGAEKMSMAPAQAMQVNEAFHIFKNEKLLFPFSAVLNFCSSF